MGFKKRWIILGILAFLALCVVFGDKQHLCYMYERHVATMLGMNSNHTHED